ncbi:hypothetical protein SDC9_106981 [bioreactor metagenome]|uniref:Uncharacterized protein n=1 Tax=bioreactor metagenome TaxID=1076179 RepID=A0A645BEJ5_9ZZZZ
MRFDGQTDKETDQMVYALYGLTEEEIKIVEQSAIWLKGSPWAIFRVI